MANTNFNTNQTQEATWTLTNSLREVNQTIAENITTAQERNVAFAQNTFENGIEVLKSHAESTRALTRELSEEPKAALQTITDSTLAAQERNTKFAQSILTNGIEVLKSHAESTQTLMHSLAEQAQKQQEAFLALAQESLDAYIGFISAPFTYSQQLFGIAQSTARQSFEDMQKAVGHTVATA